MQLIKSKAIGVGKAVKVGAALAAASSSLLGASPVSAAGNPWLVDSALLLYSESDARVKAIEPVLSMTRDMGDQKSLTLKFIYDSLTGASPNGAVVSREIQTFTRPSGRGTVTGIVEGLPKGSFEDQRSAFSIGWVQPLGESNRISVGANYSNENDYVSDGFSAAFARDFFNKNTTISLGFNVESDSSKPVGGIPNPLTASHLSIEDRKASATRKVNDFLFGVTQVINRHWLTQLNYSRSVSTGYQTDPYKIMSVVNSHGSSIKDPHSLSNTLYLYENRPENRTRQSIFWDNRIHLDNDNVVDVSLRHYSDNWGIKSNTLDLRYRFNLSRNLYLEPHYRYYSQSAADFHRPFLLAGSDVIDGVATPEYASADTRLAKFNGNTVGLKCGYSFGRNSEVSIRYEQYTQSGDSSPSIAKGMSVLSGLDLYPGLTANTLFVSFSFEL